MSARDELAEVLRAPIEYLADQMWRRLRFALADVILASDWLAQHDREVAAKAWDEGAAQAVAQFTRPLPYDMIRPPLINLYSDPESVPERHETSCTWGLERGAACDCPRGER